MGCSLGPLVQKGPKIKCFFFKYSEHIIYGKFCIDSPTINSKGSRGNHNVRKAFMRLKMGPLFIKQPLFVLRRLCETGASQVNYKLVFWVQSTFELCFFYSLKLSDYDHRHLRQTMWLFLKKIIFLF